MFESNRNSPSMTPKALNEANNDADYFKNSNSNFANNTSASQEGSYESCPHCLRKFFVGRLKLHLKSCKDSKPQQKSVKAKTIIEKTSEEVENQTGNRMVSLGNEQHQNKMVTHNRTPSFQPLNSGYQPEYNVPTAESDGEIDSKERVKAEDGRVGCFSCGRFFHEDRVAKHEKACKKSSKKRPVFDATQQRAIVEEGAVVKKHNPDHTKSKKNIQKEKSAVELPKKEEQPAKEEPHKKVPAWKSQHENFIENIRFNRKLKQMQARGEDTSHLVVPTIVNDTYVSCSYCFRKFAPATAERHIPKCKTTFNRPKPPKNLQLDKIDDFEKFDRSKSQVSPKKGVSVRKSPEIDYREPVTPTGAPTKDKTSQRSPKNNQQPDDRSPNSSPKGSNKLPQFGALKVDSKSFMKKVPSLENSKKTILPDIRKQEGENNVTAYELNVSAKNSRELRSQSPPGAKKVFMQPIPKKDELLQHYQSLFSRACQYATEECPYCKRRFAHNAAERHIPVCKSLPVRNMRKIAGDEVMSAEKKRPKMYFTGFEPKAFFTKGDNDDTIYPRSSHNGTHSTGYEHFFGQKRMKKNERRPLPLMMKSHLDSKESIAEKPPLLQKPKLFMSASHFCTSCGSKFVKVQNFCGNCGHKRDEL